MPYKITNEIYQVGGGHLTSPEDAAIYLINIDGHAALVDAGCGGATGRLIENIRACNVKTEQIEFILVRGTLAFSREKRMWRNLSGHFCRINVKGHPSLCPQSRSPA